MIGVFCKVLARTCFGGLIILSLSSCPVNAQTAATTLPSRCASLQGSEAGLKYKETGENLSDFSISIARDQMENIRYAGAVRLNGTCAAEVYAFRMSHILLKDGSIFNRQSNNQIIYMPAPSGMATLGIDTDVSDQHPALAQAQFIMSSDVDVRSVHGKKRTLAVGFWKASDTYLIAAFIREAGADSMPVELVRSGLTIHSVTFFPSPDSNSGRLGLVQSTGSDVALISLDWNHDALSRVLLSP